MTFAYPKANDYLMPRFFIHMDAFYQENLEKVVITIPLAYIWKNIPKHDRIITDSIGQTRSDTGSMVLEFTC